MGRILTFSLDDETVHGKGISAAPTGPLSYSRGSRQTHWAIECGPRGLTRSSNETSTSTDAQPLQRTQVSVVNMPLAFRGCDPSCGDPGNPDPTQCKRARHFGASLDTLRGSAERDH